MSSHDPYGSPVPEQNPYGQPQYGAPDGAQPPAYGVPEYGQPQYGAQPPAYGVPEYGQPQYGQEYGQPQYPQQPTYGTPQYGTPQYGYAEQGKSFVVTWVLSYLLGGLGIDRFYLGKIGTGILKLVTFGGCGVWWLVDLILVLVGQTRDSQGYPLAGYEQYKKVAWIVTAVLVVMGGFSGVVTGSLDAITDRSFGLGAEQAIVRAA